MSHDLWSRFYVRKADYEADERLRSLLADVSRENDDEDGVLTVTTSDGTHWVWEDVEDYCMQAGIAFDRLCEADLETNAYYRIYRPGDPVIDSKINVDNDWKPYVLCEDLNRIFGDNLLPSWKKVRLVEELMRKERDFPCPLIKNYFSDIERIARR